MLSLAVRAGTNRLGGGPCDFWPTGASIFVLCKSCEHKDMMPSICASRDYSACRTEILWQKLARKPHPNRSTRPPRARYPLATKRN